MDLETKLTQLKQVYKRHDDFFARRKVACPIYHLRPFGCRAMMSEKYHAPLSHNQSFKLHFKYKNKDVGSYK